MNGKYEDGNKKIICDSDKRPRPRLGPKPSQDTVFFYVQVLQESELKEKQHNKK